MKVEPWMTQYPTVATVAEAGFATLLAWREHLPAAQTDVERTVRRRIQARIQVVGLRDIRRECPEAADNFEKINALFEKVTGMKAPEL